MYTLFLRDIATSVQQKIAATERYGVSLAWLIAETFGQSQGRPFFQIGFRHWIIPNRVQIDTTYGDRFGESREGRWFSIGWRLLSTAFLP